METHNLSLADLGRYLAGNNYKNQYSNTITLSGFLDGPGGTVSYKYVDEERPDVTGTYLLSRERDEIFLNIGAKLKLVITDKDANQVDSFQLFYGKDLLYTYTRDSGVEQGL